MTHRMFQIDVLHENGAQLELWGEFALFPLTLQSQVSIEVVGPEASVQRLLAVLPHLSPLP